MEFAALESGTNFDILTTATAILAATRSYRRYILQNQGSVTIWLGFGGDPTAADGGGFLRLVPGASLVTSTKGTVAGIVASGTGKLCVVGAG